MNIFAASHALLEIEERAVNEGMRESQMVLFYMWLADDRFPGHAFNEAFISKMLEEMKELVKEFDEWAHKEAMETMNRDLYPW